MTGSKLLLSVILFLPAFTIFYNTAKTSKREKKKERRKKTRKKDP